MDSFYQEIPECGQVRRSWRLPNYGFLKRVKGRLLLFHEYPPDLVIKVEYQDREVPLIYYPEKIEVFEFQTDAFADKKGGSELVVCIEDQYEDDGGEWFYTELVVEYSFLPSRVAFFSTKKKIKGLKKKEKKKLFG